MIFVTNTPNNAGVAVYGDFKDFEELYEALHTVVGDEDEYLAYESPRLRVLGVCYDLRHAMMGDCDIEFVDNGMDPETFKRKSTIGSNKNIYLKINVLWPEVLFVTMALNDFVLLHARKQAKQGGYVTTLHHRNIWDTSIANVRLFQAAIAKCIKETVSESAYPRMLKRMVKDYPWFGNYITQYVDILNCRFLGMTNEKRLKSISTMAKRLAEHGTEYQAVRAEVLAYAKKHNCPVDSIRVAVEYPEDIEW